MSVFKPSNLNDLINAAKISLGEPVIKVNISREQELQCAKDALGKYIDYHYNATDDVYIAHKITEEDFENGYIQTPPNVHTVIRLMNTNASIPNSIPLYATRNMVMGGDMEGWGMNDNMISFYLARETQAYFNKILNPALPMKWNKGSGRLYIDGPLKSKCGCGNTIVYEAQVVNEIIEWDCAGNSSSNTDFWETGWLKDYTAAKMKKQWGTNLMKFQNIELVEGMQFNGQEILEQAKEELSDLMEDLEERYTLWPVIVIG